MYHKASYARSTDSGSIDNGWAIYKQHDDGTKKWDDLIAVVDTEGIADALIFALSGGYTAVETARPSAPTPARPKRKAYIATIQVVMTAESDVHACDALSAILLDASENVGGTVVDWQYLDSKLPSEDDVNSSAAPDVWRQIEILPADTYIEGSVFDAPLPLEYRIELLNLEDRSQSMPGRVRMSNNAIEIDLAGFGVGEMQPGRGFPIFIENQGGIPVLYVWPDINSPDPVKISLERAAEKYRAK
jgi:hypothetical protein